jgi:hypothetical protein
MEGKISETIGSANENGLTMDIDHKSWRKFRVDNGSHQKVHSEVLVHLKKVKIPVRDTEGLGLF